jgi:hypothetical protein
MVCTPDKSYEEGSIGKNEKQEVGRAVVHLFKINTTWS